MGNSSIRRFLHHKIRRKVTHPTKWSGRLAPRRTTNRSCLRHPDLRLQNPSLQLHQTLEGRTSFRDRPRQVSRRQILRVSRTKTTCEATYISIVLWRYFIRRKETTIKTGVFPCVRVNPGHRLQVQKSNDELGEVH